jgi:hypothetical protein
MARKKQDMQEEEPRANRDLPLVAETKEEQAKVFAELLNAPSFAATRVIDVMKPEYLEKHFNFVATSRDLQDQAEQVIGGDMKRAESMLMSQAIALQSMFVRLVEKGVQQTHMPNYEAFMRVALRAQAQCRTTLETLSNIKNPPVVFAKQANVTTGPQQVNNGIAPPSRVGETENAPNQLLDARETGETISIDTLAKAVGEIDGAKVPRG